MKDFWQNLKTWQKVGLIFGSLAAIIIIIVAIMMINRDTIKVEISFDSNTTVNIPSSELTKVRRKMLGVIETNTENFDASMTYRGTARDYAETENDSLHTATFVVDFDAISQSYFVMVSWPDPDDGSPNVIISCPIAETKYPETACVTESNASTDIVSFLPYLALAEDGTEYEVLGKYNAGELYIEVDVESCGDAKILSVALDAAKKWMRSINIDPENYQFYVPTDICNGTSSGDDRAGYDYFQADHAGTNDAVVNSYLPYFVPGLFNVYPVVDGNDNVVSIQADLAGCTDFQTDPVEEQITEYLSVRGIAYPVKFGYCVN